MLEEYQESQTIAEVEMITATNKEDESFDDDCQAAHDEAVARLSKVDEPVDEELANTSVADAPAEEDEMAVLRRRLAELEALIKQGLSVAKAAPLPRVARTWTLLNKDVSWSTKPQVHALMHIISANVAVGEEVSEDKIVAAVEANVTILRTTQPARRIWDYYKGKHVDGFIEHGNLVKK
jgi:hypothetical protein